MSINLFDPKYLLRRAKRKAVKEYADKYSKGCLLDLGCGSASFKSLFAKTVDRYVGLDYPVTSEHMGYQDVVYEIASDARALPLQSRCADSVLLLDVLEHVFEVNYVLSEAARVLKPGGYLLLTTPFIYPVHGKPYDFHRFSFYALEKYLERNNFTVVKNMVMGNYGTVLAVLINQFIYRAFWIRGGWLHLIGLVLRPILVLIIAMNNLIGWFLDIIASHQPTWTYLEGAVICERNRAYEN